MSAWRVDYTPPGWTPPGPARCPACEWAELHAWPDTPVGHVLVTPCKEHQ